MTDPAPTPAPYRPSGGRPTLLTPALADRIVQVVSAGNYLKTAAQFAGVGQSTLMLWLARGRAAAAAVEAHADGHRRCPQCDTDREADAASVDAANAAEEEAYRQRVRTAEHLPGDPAETAEPRAYAVLDHCPTCGSDEQPRPWELDPREGRFLEFLERVTQAETVAEVSAVTHWRRAFGEDWRAARDYLGRKRPEQWAAKTTVAISSEEAEARIENAVAEALTALGVDTSGITLDADDDPAGVDDDDAPRDL